MSRSVPPPGPKSESHRLPAQTSAVPSRPAGSLDRIEVLVHCNAWDVYRMEIAESWRRSHSADATVIANTFPFAVVLYLLLDIFYVAFAPRAWKDTIVTAALWLLILWGAWWIATPFLKAFRQAESAQLRPPVRFVSSPEGVEIIRPDFSMQIAWPGIRRVRETWFSFLIYPRQPSPYKTTPDGRLIQVLPWMKLYFTIPRHCFADQADLRLFRTLMRKHVTVK
jgi:hypothetical protein